MEKLKIGWGIRAKRYEDKIKSGAAGNLAKKCWLEKERMGRKDLYSKERSEYFNRNGWGVEAIDTWEGGGEELELELIRRERDIQRQEEEGKILESRYNKKYKEIGIKSGEGGPRYLGSESLNKAKGGEGIRALINLRCGSMEEANKYWLEEEERKCVFCEEGWDNIEHYIESCQKITGDWSKLGKSKNKIMEKLLEDELDRDKEKLLGKLWKERKKAKKARKEKEKLAK